MKYGALMVLAACGSSSNAVSPDAAPDAPPPPTCVTGSAFGSVLTHPELDPTDRGVQLSADQLDAVFQRSGTIYIARRASTEDAFGSPVPVTSAGAGQPALTPDGLGLVVLSNHMFVVGTRATRTDAFGAFTSSESVPSTVDSFSVTRDAVYAAQMSGTSTTLLRGTFDATYVPSSFAMDSTVSALFPVISGDESTAYECRISGSGVGEGCSVMVDHRMGAGQPWAGGTNEPALQGNGPALGQSFYTPTWTSDDGCVLYYQRQVSSTEFHVEEVRRTYQ